MAVIGVDLVAVHAIVVGIHEVVELALGDGLLAVAQAQEALVETT